MTSTSRPPMGAPVQVPGVDTGALTEHTPVSAAMTQAMHGARLQVSGVLRDDALYMNREADVELFESLRGGEFCSILAPRQIGKSSLRHRTARRLAAIGVHCVEIDLTALGKSADHSPIVAWYFSLACHIADQLGLAEPRPFLAQHRDLLPVDAFGLYLKKQVLTALPGPLVIFFDEIDYLRALPPPLDRDEFLVALRALYNGRAEHPELARLRICLLGVTAPRDLVKDPSVTPFNIGRAVQLHDFRRVQLDGLAPSLAALGDAPGAWIDAIFEWTAGHPYMTQALCHQLLKTRPAVGSIAQRVEQAVTARFLQTGRTQDDNVIYAEKRLDESAYRGELLALYRDLLQGPVALCDGDPVQQELQLCGLAAPEVGASSGGHRLRLRNRIFARVFDLAWLADKDGQHLLLQAVRRWQGSAEQNDNALLRGAELLAAERWANDHAQQVTSQVHRYLRACIDAARRAAEQARLVSEARMQRRLIMVWASVVGLILLGLALTSYTLYLRATYATQAERAAREQAATQLRLEKSLRAAVISAHVGQNVPALVLAMQAVRDVRDSPLGPVWEGLHAAVAAASVTRSVRILAGHQGPVQCAGFSPDGTSVVTGSQDGTACIWDIEKGDVTRTLRGHTRWVSAVSFSPDGQRVLTASWDKTARIWDARTGELLRTLTGHTEAIGGARFSRDGSRVVTGSRDHSVRLWDAQTGQLLHKLDGHQSLVLAVAFSPDGRRIASGSHDMTARIWDARTGRLLRTLEGHTDRVGSINFSPDGRWVVTGSWDRTARVWDADSGINRFALAGHASLVSSTEYSPDGSFIITASGDKTANIWDAATGKLRKTLTGHDGAVTSACFSPNGQRVVTASVDQTARVWSAQLGQSERLLSTLEGHTSWVSAAGFSPDGRRVLTASRDHTARVWDARSGRLLMTLSDHSDEVKGVAASSDGRRIVTGGLDKTVRIFDATTGKLLQSMPSGGAVTGAMFSPDDGRVLSSHFDNRSRVWDVESGALLFELNGHGHSVTGAAYSPDGRLIATSSHDHTAKVYDAHSGVLLRTLAGHAGSVSGVAFSPDSHRIVTSSRDRTARIWDAQTGVLLNTLRGHAAWLTGVAYSSDGHRVVTSSADHTARVWDADQGALLMTLTGHAAYVNSAAFSPDGRYVVTSGDDQTARLHPLDPAELYELGCQFLRSVPHHPDAQTSEVQEIVRSCRGDPTARIGAAQLLRLGPATAPVTAFSD